MSEEETHDVDGDEGPDLFDTAVQQEYWQVRQRGEHSTPEGDGFDHRRASRQRDGGQPAEATDRRFVASHTRTQQRQHTKGTESSNAHLTPAVAPTPHYYPG